MSTFTLMGTYIKKNFRRSLFMYKRYGRGDRIRTCDPRFWRPMLWPAELLPYRPIYDSVISILYFSQLAEK